MLRALWSVYLLQKDLQTPQLYLCEIVRETARCVRMRACGRGCLLDACSGDLQPIEEADKRVSVLKPVGISWVCKLQRTCLWVADWGVDDYVATL